MNHNARVLPFQMHQYQLRKNLLTIKIVLLNSQQFFHCFGTPGIIIYGRLKQNWINFSHSVKVTYHHYFSMNKWQAAFFLNEWQVYYVSIFPQWKTFLTHLKIAWFFLEIKWVCEYIFPQASFYLVNITLILNIECCHLWWIVFFINFQIW